ncbi:hypothetical protein OnM2_025136, partial [Erysiphe neolycopersici]
MNKNILSHTRSRRKQAQYVSSASLAFWNGIIYRKNIPFVNMIFNTTNIENEVKHRSNLPAPPNHWHDAMKHLYIEDWTTAAKIEYSSLWNKNTFTPI